MQQNQQQQEFGMREKVNLFYAAAKIHAFSFYPFLRRDFGTEATGFAAFYAMILMLLVGGLGRVPLMFPYLACWLIVLACQRLRTYWLVWRGVVWHSKYEGYPKLALSFPFVRKESTAKGVIEPLLCLGAGAALYPFSHDMGVFVMIGCISLAAVEGVHKTINRKRLAAMRDGQIEQQWLTRRFRGEIDD